MAHRLPFYLFKRKLKYGNYWYVCYLDPVSGKQTTAKSIDIINSKLLKRPSFTRIKRRDEAAIIAFKALEEGLIFAAEKEQVFFAEYLIHFWTYDKSEYINKRNRFKPNSIGRDYAANMLYNIKVNVIPFLPHGVLLSEVTTSMLEKVLEALFQKGLASSSINAISFSWSIPLKEAKREGLIDKNPAENVIKIWKEERPRDSLKATEVERFCQTLVRMKETINKHYYYALILAVSTGMRCGEIRALNTSDFEASSYPGYTRLIIRHSISTFSGLKDTKGKYERSVFIPTYLAEALTTLATPDGKIFPSPMKKDGYISSPTLRNEFYRLLSISGIKEGERKRRNITFHSLRHTFSTLGRDMSVSQEDRMVVLGHKSEEVNNRYTHVSDEALKRVSVITDAILDAFSCEEKSED